MVSQIDNPNTYILFTGSVMMKLKISNLLV